MRECFVSFASVEDVHRFVSITTQQFFSVHVENGQMQTNGKSIMSLCSMGLNRPLRVLYPAEAEGFLQAVSPYLVS